MLTDGSSSRPSKLVKEDSGLPAPPVAAQTSGQLALIKQTQSDRALAVRAPTMPKPKWHPQWKLMRVISGHLGWVRCVAVEPGNEWFVTGSADRTIKIWDLASGTLKLSLTGQSAACYYYCYHYNYYNYYPLPPRPRPVVEIISLLLLVVVACSLSLDLSRSLLFPCLSLSSRCPVLTRLVSQVTSVRSGRWQFRSGSRTCSRPVRTSRSSAGTSSRTR